ncbi:hypothetical protein ACOSOMT5_P1016 [Acidiphilium sp. MT5]|jgi:hypothetical protein
MLKQSDRLRGVSLLIEILVNILLPYLIYVETKPSLDDVHALMASSLPPILWSMIEFARKRRVDAISIMVITGIILSLLAFIGGGSVRFLQLRENLVSGLVAIVFLGSVVIDKPLIFTFARATMARRSHEQADEFAALQVHAGFRATMRLMTLVWGFGLLASAALSIILVYRLSIRHYLLVSPFLSYGTFGALGLWSFWYGRYRRRQH